MTKEEFKTKKDIINSKIEELNNEMENSKGSISNQTLNILQEVRFVQ